MLSQEYSIERERIIAEALTPFASELRLVSVEHFIAFMVLERYTFIADIVKSSAEMHFTPGFLELGHGGQVRLDWDSAPSITLDLVLRPAGVTVWFSLTLAGEAADLSLNYISFKDPSACPDENTEVLRRSIAVNRFREPANGLTIPAAPSATPSPLPARD
jgi:hypothetical protein